MRLGFSAATIMMLALATAAAEDRPSDAEIRAALVGSWIVPRDSSDYSELVARSLETYRVDGTATGTLFTDARCIEVAMQVTLLWSVENGVLTSRYPSGEQSRDEILEVGNGRLTLRSLEDGTTYTREQAESCGQHSS